MIVMRGYHRSKNINILVLKLRKRERIVSIGFWFSAVNEGFMDVRSIPLPVDNRFVDYLVGLS